MATYDERVQQREAELDLALYFARELIKELGKERALEIIERAWTQYGVDFMNRRLKGVPSEDRLKALGEWFKENAKERQELKVIEATPRRVSIEISRCPTFDVCQSHGLPEICQKYCDSDYAVARAINPKVRLVRDSEIAHGAGYCNHCWVLED